MSLKYVLIGAGKRGQAYSEAAFKEHGCEIVAVADPNENVRNYIRDTYNVPHDMCFESYEQVLKLGKIADFAMICTQDKMHMPPAMMAIEQGYDILLEKPAAPTPEECMQLCKAAEAKGVRVLICHVLRYTKFFRAVKDIIDSGRIGKIMSVIHSECVGDVHYSHSYVRGNWHNSKESCNMLLAKSCHDLDILQWLIGADCKKIQSFGRLSYFNKDNCPEGAPKRCLEGCPHEKTCAYSTRKIYLPENPKKWAEFLRSAATGKVNPTDAEVEQALWDTNYGVCVFQSDNDVVDHQTVNMEFEMERPWCLLWQPSISPHEESVLWAPRVNLALRIWIPSPSIPSASATKTLPCMVSRRQNPSKPLKWVSIRQLPAATVVEITALWMICACTLERT